MIFLILFAWILPLQDRSTSVTPVNEEELRSIIKDRNGKDLFINVWATWCEPCKEEFPDLISAVKDSKRKYPSIDFVSISADFPDEIESKIIPFLSSFDSIPFSVYVSDYTSQDIFISTIDPTWQGSIPATFYFDTSGTLKGKMIGARSKQQFDAFIYEQISTP